MRNLIRSLTSWRKKESRPDKPTAILHIGVEKTGTSTIQEFLHLNRKMLAENGICFPKSIGMRNHRPLASWCISDQRNDVFLRMNQLTQPSKRKQWKREFILGFEAELSGLSSEIKQVIFSSEHFSSLLNHPAEIKTLKQILGQWFTNIRVLVYLRRQDSLTVSTYSNVCRAGIVSDKVLTAPKELRPFVNYRNMLHKWSRIFGMETIEPVVFEKNLLYQNDLIADFVHRNGLPEHLNYKIPENKNESLSQITQEAAQLFNRKFPVDSAGIPFKQLQKTRKELIESVNAKYPGPGKKPVRQEAETFYKYFQETNNGVARKWFGREKLFEEDFSMYPDTEQIVDQELVKHLVEDFITRKKLVPTHE
jgi:hypothetical protein